MSAADQIRAILVRFEAGEILYSLLEDAPLDDGTAVLAMTDGLRSSSWRAALGCANALRAGAPRFPFVIPALIRALDHEESSVREAAAKALGKYQSGEVVEPLLRALARDVSDSEAKHFVEALGAIAQHVDRVLPVLESLIVQRIQTKDDYGLGRAAITAIGQFGESARSSKPTLLAALKAQSIMMSVDAAIVLTKIGLEPEELIPAVCDFVADRANAHGRWHAVSVLAHLRADAMPNLVIEKLIGVVEHQDHLTNLTILAPFAKHADAALLTPYLRDPKLRDRAAQLIGQTGDARAIPALLEVVGDGEPAVAEALTLVGKGQRDVVATLLAIHNRQTGDRQNFLRDLLGRLGRKTPVPADGFDIDGRFERALPIEGRVVGVVAADGALWLGLHRKLVTPPEDDWMNDEDAFTLARCDGESITLFSMPVAWPVKPSGAHHAKREFELAGWSDSGILIKVESPFSDDRGWGRDTFLFRFSPSEGWSRFEKTFVPIQEAWVEDTSKRSESWQAEIAGKDASKALLKVKRSSSSDLAQPGSRWTVGRSIFYGIEDFATNVGATSVWPHGAALVDGKLLLVIGDRVLVFKAP